MRAVAWGGLFLSFSSLHLLAEPQPGAAAPLNLAAAVKETYDSNIYLQSQTTRANEASFVTTLQPQLAAAWQPDAALRLNFNYAPEFAWFEGATEENFVAHRANLLLTATSSQTKYEWRNSLTWIDGSDQGPTWTAPGGAPATGGVPVRDRRDATVSRSSFTLTHDWEHWFIRPSLAGYHHDFQTAHRATAGYQNYVDRSEVLGGMDWGYHATHGARVWIGARYGAQDQARLLNFPEVYDNTFQRLLLGLESEWAPGCKITANLGPEFRRYGPEVPSAFGTRQRSSLYVDAALTLSPTLADTVQFACRRFTQPGFGGRSTYVDFTLEANWKHQFNSTWTAGVLGRGYQTKFARPITRDDWVLAASTFVACTLDQHWSAEVSYGYEEGLTHTANAAGREYQRHWLTLGLRYAFQ